MKINVFWGNSQHTHIVYQFPTEWTWHDLEQAKRRAQNLMISCEHAVYLVGDMTNTTGPSNLLSGTMYLSRDMNHQKIKRILIVNPPLLIPNLITMLKMLNHPLASYLQVVKSHEQALSIINHAMV